MINMKDIIIVAIKQFCAILIILLSMFFWEHYHSGWGIMSWISVFTFWIILFICFEWRSWLK